MHHIIKLASLFSKNLIRLASFHICRVVYIRRVLLNEMGLVTRIGLAVAVAFHAECGRRIPNQHSDEDGQQNDKDEDRCYLKGKQKLKTFTTVAKFESRGVNIAKCLIHINDVTLYCLTI